MPFTSADLTREQAAAYINAQAVVVLGELLAMHWANEQHKQLIAAGKLSSEFPLPYSAQKIQDRIEKHVIQHGPMMALFERAKGKP